MRMRRMILPLLVLLATLSLLLAGCSGLGYMIEEYNSRFGIHDDSVLLPGDMGYDEKDMLAEQYHVDSTTTVNIPAPQVKGARYLWELYQEGKLVEADYDGSHHTFQLYLPETLRKGTYQLYLTLTVDGKEYKDNALVTVHVEDVGQQPL